MGQAAAMAVGGPEARQDPNQKRLRDEEPASSVNEPKYVGPDRKRWKQSMAEWCAQWSTEKWNEYGWFEHEFYQGEAKKWKYDPQRPETKYIWDYGSGGGWRRIFHPPGGGYTTTPPNPSPPRCAAWNLQRVDERVAAASSSEGPTFAGGLTFKDLTFKGKGKVGDDPSPELVKWRNDVGQHLKDLHSKGLHLKDNKGNGKVVV